MISPDEITIVLPTIGRPKYFNILLDSVLTQKTRPGEILVYNNSGDDQKCVEDSILQGTPHLREVMSEKRLSPDESWNNAIASSTGKYIVLLGDDDVAWPNLMDQALAILQRRPFGILRNDRIDSAGRRLRSARQPIECTLSPGDFITARLSAKFELALPGLVFSREAFDAIGGFSNTRRTGNAGSDEIFAFEAAVRAGGVELSPEVCWGFRIHPGQIGNKDPYADEDEGMVILQQRYKRIISKAGETGVQLPPLDRFASIVVWRRHARAIISQNTQAGVLSALICGLQSDTTAWLKARLVYSAATVFLKSIATIRTERRKPN